MIKWLRDWDLRTTTTVIVSVVLIFVFLGWFWVQVSEQKAAEAAFTPVSLSPTPTQAAEQKIAEARPSQETVAVAEETSVPGDRDTPTPTLTPFVVTPTPETDIFTLATRVAEQEGTSTPLPSNAVVATPTQEPVVFVNTPTPANEKTKVFRECWEAVHGTATPLPTYAVTATPTDRPTPTSTPTATPLLVSIHDEETLSHYVRPTREISPTPTRGPVPSELRGRIVFKSDMHGQSRVYAADPDGTNVQYLVDADWYYELVENRHLSKDGEYIVYQKRSSHGLDLFLRPVSGHWFKQLTFVGRGEVYDFAWSPDGNAVAYASNESGNDEIRVVRRMFNGNPWSGPLTNTEERVLDKHPWYSPDGSQIVFCRHLGEEKSIWIMNADGSGKHELDLPGNCWDPVWVW